MIAKMPPVVAGLLFLTGTTAVMGGMMTYRAGAVRVSVDENRPGGDHVHIFVPAVMIPTAMGLIPEKALRNHPREIRPWLPAIKVASHELNRVPDSVLVEVSDPQEHVTISKQGGAVVVDVQSRDENVHVTVPLGMIRSVAEKLEAGSPPV
jgi:hypothetical protein